MEVKPVYENAAVQEIPDISLPRVLMLSDYMVRRSVILVPEADVKSSNLTLIVPSPPSSPFNEPFKFFPCELAQVPPSFLWPPMDEVDRAVDFNLGGIAELINLTRRCRKEMDPLSFQYGQRRCEKSLIEKVCLMSPGCWGRRKEVPRYWV